MNRVELNSAQIHYLDNERNAASLNFTDASPNVVHNVAALCQRQAGTIFRVNQDGRFEEVSGLCGKIKYSFWGESQAVKEKVSEALGAFDAFLSRLNDERISRCVVQHYFLPDGAIGRLSQNIFDRQVIQRAGPTQKFSVPENTLRLQIGSDHFFDFKVRDQQAHLPIDCGHGVENDNLWMLLKRKKGEIYQVNSEGRLEKAHGHLNSARQQEVKQVVTQAISSLNHYLSTVQVNRVHRIAIEQIFTKSSLTRMSQTVYYRGIVSEGSKIEKALTQDLDQLRMNFRQAMKTYRDQRTQASKKAFEEAFLNFVVGEFKFAQSLGVDLERNKDGGSGGARYGLDRFGRRILVVKPGDEGPHGVNNPQWYARLKRLFISPRPCLEGVSEPLSEVDSYVFDRTFNFYAVPPTTLDYVASQQFNGPECKECSLQMFVKGCDTLGDFLEVSSWDSWLPRPLQRWKLKQREGGERDLLNKLPQSLIERVAVHNGLIEDIDCHFENILAKLVTPLAETHPLKRLMNGEDVQDAEIDTFVDSFFADEHNQQLLDILLTTETNQAGERVMLVKHDGGSSNPRHHPKVFLAKRFKHLFEVLPHFERAFSEETRRLFDAEAEQKLEEVIMNKAKRGIRNIMTQNLFQQFWSSEENQAVFGRWIHSTEQSEFNLRRELIQNLVDIELQVSRQQLLEFINSQRSRQIIDRKEEEINQLEMFYRAYFNYHFKRILGSLQTRRESFEVLKDYVRSDQPMREFFKNVKSEKDFQRELARIQVS